MNTFKPRIKPLSGLIHAALLGIGLGAGIHSNVAHAQATTQTSTQGQQSYNIPAGPLGSALEQFARTAGVNLSYNPALVAGKQSQGAQGTFSKQTALELILGNTGVEASAQQSGGFVLRAAPVRSGGTLPTVSVAAQVEQETATSPVIGYQAKQSSTATRSDIALRDTPQSVTVIGEQAIKDLAPRALDEIADYIAGVDKEGVQGNPYALSFYLRGFNTAGAASAYNGFRESGFETPQSAVNIERIEFLKGPASVLYGGAGSLSGLVNIVTKRPQAEPSRTIETTVGSFGLLGTSLDSTGSLNEDGSVRYRLTADLQKDGFFAEQLSGNSTMVSPVLAWDISEDTTVEFELLTQNIDRPGREAYFIRHPDFFKIPTDIQLGDPTNPVGAGGKLTRDLARVDFTHKLENGWKFRQGFYANNVYSDDSTIQGTSYDPTTNLLSRRVRQVESYDRSRISQTELSGIGQTGNVSHNWLAGFEYGKITTGYGFIVAPYTPLNIFNPQYPGQATGPLVEPFPGVDSGSNTQAIYVQDLIDFGNGIKALLGGRYDELETFSQERFAGSSKTEKSDSAFSPRAGLVWQPRDDVSYYSSWAKSFTPNNGRDVNGNNFEPQEGEQFEVGVKYNLNPRLSINAAVFDYTRQNVVTTDPNNPTFNITVGEQQSQGIEFEVFGEVVPGWEVIASYNYIDAKITQDNRLPVGDQLTGVPENAFGLFNKFNLGRFGLSRWSLTAGVSYADARVSGLPNDPAGPLTAADVELPSYTKVDAGVIYDAGDWSVRLSGGNLADEAIYDGYISTFAPRAGRSFNLTYSTNF
ncbi:TonB-dependent siderophore receptor [Limnobacter sp.]|uniref:TonB-dependent siderophore receptor n=1 Tax=Limnobacter sp. TaxID=2003368 RepID=UPI00391D03C9